MKSNFNLTLSLKIKVVLVLIMKSTLTAVFIDVLREWSKYGLS